MFDTIFAAMEEHCNIVNCQNGATCYNVGTRYECVCAGDYFGHLCADCKFWVKKESFEYSLETHVRLNPNIIDRKLFKQ